MLSDGTDAGSHPFILDCTELSNGNGDLVSVGEDGSVVVWRNQELYQSIPHPSCVWCVIPTPNGGFLTGSHDGAIRLFSSSLPPTLSSEEVLNVQANFNALVEEARLKRTKGPSASEIAKLPFWEDRGKSIGQSEGFVKLFNKSGMAIAAQWSQDSKIWIEVGEVSYYFETYRI